MQAPHQSRISRKIVKIHSKKYLVRSITADDASDRWARWMSDPETMHMLNMPARSWKKSDVINYIKTFDQRSHLLLGIFEKQSRAHIGILTIDIDYRLSQFLVNLLIGEPEYRNRGVTSDITVPFRDYFFETLGLNMMMASVLARNSVIIHYLLSSGWKLDHALERRVKSNTDGAMLDVCLFSLSRDSWRAWKTKSPAPNDKD
jgi:RimJ/RimL family protein N-acetyltransferase